MTFQRVVNRAFTTGFPGEIVRDGPTRAKAVRIAASSKATDPRFEGNLVGRVYGYVGEVPVTGTTLAALAPTVEIGAPVYAGVLIHPKHYVLQGTIAGGTLAPSLALVDGSEGEVADMAIIVAEVFNVALTAVSVTPAFAVGYIPSTVGATETVGIPFGALVVGANAAALTDVGAVLIPGAKVLNTIGLSASAVDAPVSGLTIIQLTL